MNSKPILCLDFDGVLHSYTSGWKGPAVVADAPVAGAIEFLKAAVEVFEVHIFSSRSSAPGGSMAMRSWLGEHIIAADPGVMRQNPPWFAAIKWPTEKPAALVTIDDRALTFTGEWPALADLLAFKPWNRR